MTSPSQTLVKINARRSKIIFRLLIVLLVSVVGGFIYFYKTIPKENLDRLIGKSNSAKGLVYRATPPGLDEKNSKDIIASLKAGVSKEVYVARLEKEFLKSKDENKELKVEINKLNHKLQKQKKIINKLLK